MSDDTRVALVREDTADRLLRAVLLSGIPLSFVSVELLKLAIRAELFPETDKPLRVGHIKTAQIALDDRAYRALWGDHADPKPDEANARIEEELNRG